MHPRLPDRRVTRPRATWVVAVLATAIVLAAAAPSPASTRSGAPRAAADAADGVISGRVTAYATGLPLGGISVTAILPNATDSGLVAAAHSADDGTFRMSVPAGSYEVYFADYSIPEQGGPLPYEQEQWPDSHRIDHAPQLVTVRSGQPTDDIDAAMERSSTISGRVLDRSGKPQAYADVLLTGAGDYWMRTSTSETGTWYAIVPPGELDVTFGDGVDLRHDYWPESNDPEHAQPVVIGKESTVGGIDAVLDPTATITGRITLTDGTPSGALFELQKLVDGVWTPIRSVQTGEDGDYRLSDFGAGDYRIHVTNDGLGQPGQRYWGNTDPQWYDGAAGTDDPDRARVITVDEEGSSGGHDIRLLRRSTMCGFVRDAPGGVRYIPNQIVILMRRDAAGHWQRYDGDSLRDDGQGAGYCFSGLIPGHYQVLVDARLPRIPAYYPGVPLAQAQDIVVPAHQDITDIDIALQHDRWFPVTPPRLRGKAKVGRTLIVDTGRWGPATQPRSTEHPLYFDFFWFADGKRVPDSVEGQHTISLKLTRGMAGKRMTVRVTALGSPEEYHSGTITTPRSARVQRR